MPGMATRARPIIAPSRSRVRVVNALALRTSCTSTRAQYTGPDGLTSAAPAHIAGGLRGRGTASLASWPDAKAADVRTVAAAWESWVTR
jgi:hypothetical protein